MGELTEQTQADAKDKEANADLERMQRKHLLLQTEFEAQRVSLENSRHFTWDMVDCQCRSHVYPTCHSAQLDWILD